MARPSKKPVTVGRIRSRMTLFFTLLVLIVLYAGSIVLYIHIRRSTVKNFLPQVTAIDLQMASTVDSFTASAELDCTEAFRRGCVTDYDPIIGDIKDYEAQSVKNDMKNRLLGLSAGRNYNDFFVIFSDSETVGKVSSGTSELVSRLGYELFSDRLGGMGDCWFYSPAVSTSKVYYLRRATDHSLFVLSFYTKELETLFSDLGDYGNTFVLTTEKDVVIVSNDAGLRTGTKLPVDVSGLFDNKDGESVVYGGVLGASVAVDAGWHMIVTVPTPVPDLPVKGVIIVSAIFLAVTSLVCWLIGLAAAAPFRLEELKAEGSEFIDPPTGRFNEYGLDENISEKLETSLVGSTYAFIMLGIKDSDQIRNAISAKYWNDLRTQLIENAEQFFADREFIIGRSQSDRIIIFADYSQFDIFKAHQTLEENCEEFSKSFNELAVGEDNAIKLYVNVGVSIYPDSAEDFDTLLEKASKAFAAAEDMEGDGFALYDPSKHESEGQ